MSTPTKALPKTFFQSVNWGDVLRKTQHLSPGEFGTYLRLYAQYWETGRALPGPKGGMMGGMMGGFNEALYRVCLAQGEDERKVVDSILEEYFVLHEGRWYHSDLEEQLERRLAKHLKLSDAGKTGVEVRENNRKAGMMGGIKGGLSEASRVAYAIPNTNPYRDSISPTPLTGDKPGDNVDKSFLDRTGGYDIARTMSATGLQKAKSYCERLNRDVYELIRVYNQGVGTRRQPPNVPDIAFYNWLRKYTKGVAL